MPARSIEAYSPRERVDRYDRDMAIMHPNRTVMVQAVVDTLPFDRDSKLQILDLGVGSGVLAEGLVNAFSNAHVTGIDGSASMLECARERLAPFGSRADFIEGDFRNLDNVIAENIRPDAVVSAFALHHVPASEKPAVLKSVVSLLTPGGWLLNADIVIAGDPVIEARWQDMRVAGIVERAKETGDPRFASTETTRAYLDAMEAEEGDCPQTLTTELSTLEHAGLRHVGVFWQNTREAVYGGFRTG